MLDPLVVAPVGIGILLLIAGATLARYGVALMGALVGAGGGYLVAPTVGEIVGVGGLAASAVGIGLGIAAGVLVAHILLSLAVAAIGFGVGTYVGFTVLAPILVDGAWFVEAGAALAVGAAIALAGMTLTNLTMMALTSFVGAALVSRSLTFEQFAQAQSTVSPRPLLFDAGDPRFLALLAVGFGVQLGLLRFGYARRIIGILPGAGLLLGDRGKGSAGR